MIGKYTLLTPDNQPRPCITCGKRATRLYEPKSIQIEKYKLHGSYPFVAVCSLEHLDRYTLSFRTPHQYFSGYLMHQIDQPTPIGDLARDCWADVLDGCLNSRSYDGIRRHMLEKHHADKIAIDVLEDAYQGYKAFPYRQ